MSDFIELMCKLMHESYEEAAIANGWQTQVRSRVAWVDVPEANKKTMRVAVSDVIDNVLDYEQERIIELLQAGRHESHAIDDIFDGVVGMGISRADFKQELIALIKGENK